MKMNISMEFIKPLAGTLKKYTALLPSVVITAVALLLFLPTMMIGGKVKEQMKESVGIAQTVQRLSKNVPSKEEPELKEIRMNKLEEEAEKIKMLAAQSSQRDLVTYDHVIFPKPEGRSNQIYTEFGKKYRSAVDDLLDKINALDAPSEAEIQAETGGPGGNQPVVHAGKRTTEAEDPAVNALCLTRAKEASVYANRSGFAWYEFWEDYEFSGQDQALEDCWDSQVSFWIYEDIVDTIANMNGSGGDVLSSPVKRLLGVSFTGPVTVENRGMAAGFWGAANNIMRDVPNYVTGMLPSNFLADSPTARISDEDIDVIHFAVSVLVDSRFISGFMKELCSEKTHTFYPSIFEEPFTQEGQPVDARHNQITILQADLKVVNKKDPIHELYRYGKGAVMRLDLVCEYQFNRMGYDKIKPEPINVRLGSSAEQGTSPAAPGGPVQRRPAFPSEFF